MKKVVGFLILLFMSSCGKFPPAIESSPTIEVNFYQDLPQCNADYEAFIGRVKSESKAYRCHNNKWVLLD